MENNSNRIPFRVLWRAAFNIFAAILMLSVCGALGYWGWYLTKRDVSEIPVIRALEGPVRVQPEDPGGRNVNYTGLLSNKVQEVNPKLEEEGVSRIKLAPDSVPSFEPSNQLEPNKVISSESPKEEKKEEVSIENNTVSSLSVGMTPEIKTETEKKVVKLAVSAPEVSQSATLKTSILAPERTPFPFKRPANLIQANRQQNKKSLTTKTDSIGVNPNNIARGAWLADIEIYNSEAEARMAWKQMVKAFGKLAEGKRRVINPMMVGNTTLYNLRVSGFTDRAEVRRFCAFLEVSAMRCKPVQNG